MLVCQRARQDVVRALFEVCHLDHFGHGKRRHRVGRLVAIVSPRRSTMKRDGRTRNGQISDQLIRVGNSEPLGEVRFWKFFANDRSHVKGFELLEGAFELQWRMGRRVMRRFMNHFRFAIGGYCSMLFSVAV